MAEAAHRLKEKHSLRMRLVDALVGRKRDDAARESETWVSFAELVWAHYERQRELSEGVRDGEWEREYRRRLRLFTKEYGRILESYWCRYEASAVVLTEEERPRRARNLWRRDVVLRMHGATDWRTSNAPDVFAALHRWETMAIKVSEVLRESSERIALQWIFAASTRLLAFVDRRVESDAASPASLDLVLSQQQDELEQVEQYYARAGDNSARIVYFNGMLRGTIVLAAFAGVFTFVLWLLDGFHPHQAATQNLFVSFGTGALGAIVSVMTRMATENGFAVDYEVGRKSVRHLGALRPWIGGVLALVVYLALRSNLLEIGQTTPHGIYFYSTLAFLAGFSERRAKILLGSVDSSSAAAPTPTPKRDTPSVREPA